MSLSNLVSVANLSKNYEIHSECSNAVYIHDFQVKSLKKIFNALFLKQIIKSTFIKSQLNASANADKSSRWMSASL